MTQSARRPRMPVRLAAIGLLALLPGTAGAAPLAAEYTVQAAGMTLMRAQAVWDLDAPGGAYRLALQVQPSGMLRMLGAGEHSTTVEGRWLGAEPLPQRYRATGTWRGVPRRLVMDWSAAGVPVVQQIEPANDDREPVPEGLQRDTIDGLSAVAKLTRAVIATGRCEAAARMFDGRRRTDQAVRTLGTEPLALAGGSSATQIRCAVESRLLAGRHRDQDPAEAAKPLVAQAWFAPIGPGGVMVPVRVEVPTRWFGAVRIQLVQVAPAPPQGLTSGPGSARQQLAEQRR